MANMYKKVLAFVLFGCGFFSVAAQVPVELHITHMLGSNYYSPEQAVANDMGHPFKPTRISYYISGISIKHDGGLTTYIPDYYILADANKHVVAPFGTFNITHVDSISFCIGVDAATNHKDPSVYPATHPLSDQENGMHWGWASGYRFIVVEGKAAGSAAMNYEIHAVGDRLYYKTTVPVSASASGGKLIIPVKADYLQAIKGLSMTTGMAAHGDGAIEEKLTKNFRDYVFSAGTAVTAAPAIVAGANTLAVYPNPAIGGLVSLRFGNSSIAAQVVATDAAGRIAATAQKPAGAATVGLILPGAGVYFVKTVATDGTCMVASVVVQ